MPGAFRHGVGCRLAQCDRSGQGEDSDEDTDANRYQVGRPRETLLVEEPFEVRGLLVPARQVVVTVSNFSDAT